MLLDLLTVLISHRTLALRSVESSLAHEIELGYSEITLFSGQAPWPSTFTFAIPLMPDTPQSVHTPHSSLAHTLTAVLHPVDGARATVSQSVDVYTRRYTSHTHTIPTLPQSFTLDNPTPIEIQVPRTSFKANEAIPVYVTIPPPPSELVVEAGVRLRNIRAELVRVVEVNPNADAGDLDQPKSASRSTVPPLEGSSSSSAQLVHSVNTVQTPKSPLLPRSSYRRVVGKSGASCRFHATRTLRIRFLLNQPSLTNSPTEPSMEVPTVESDIDSAPISQTTLLHSTTFHLNVLISFVDISTRTERISTVRIPIDILPPSAPLPEVSASIDADYRKKHDRPPLRTVRLDDAESAVPQYSEGQAGPSAIPYGAPPPFEERDAPPPFFTPGEGSTAAGLPSFLESEREIIVANDHAQAGMHHVPSTPFISGEGIEFGFTPALQFDGHAEDTQRSSTPPPSLEMASRDTDLTGLTELQEPERAIEALGLVLDQHEEQVRGGEPPPPPPPPMDDPSDPPPGIDFHFASGGGEGQERPPTPPPPHDSYEPPHESYELPTEPPVPEQEVYEIHEVTTSANTSPPPLPAPSIPSTPTTGQASHDPPPYLGNHAAGAGTRPPPYVD